MDPANLRPLRVGEILDTALTIYRQRARTLMRAVVIVVAPVQVLSAIVQLSAGGGEGLTTSTNDVSTGIETTVVEWSALIGFIVASLGVAALGVVANQLATGACLKSVSSAYLSGDPDWRESLQFAQRRLGSLIWLAMIYAIGLGLAFLLCIAPSVYFYGAWAVATPVLMIEDKRGRKALRRSRELVKGRWGPTFLAVVLAGILGSVVQVAISGVLLGVIASGANDVVQAAANAIAGTASAVLVTPFSAAIAVVLYFDLRVRKEGFDLELLAQRVGIDPPDGTTFAPSPLPPARPAADDDDQPPFWPPPPGWRPGG